MAIGTLVRSISAGEPVELFGEFGDGSSGRDYTYTSACGGYG